MEVKQKGWSEFRTTGLLLFVNHFLQIFGWSIIMESDDRGDIVNVYPARVKVRGFSKKSSDNAYKKISKYMMENSKDLNEDVK